MKIITECSGECCDCPLRGGCLVVHGDTEYMKIQSHTKYDYDKKKENKNMDDGCYVEFFAIKDGKRYSAKTVSLKEMSMTMTNGIMDSIEKLWQ